MSALKKEFSKETKSTEASKVFIRRKDTHRERMGNLRERERERENECDTRI